MHLHEYISQGLESILGALDIDGCYDKQRTITIATTPSVGALVLPTIYRAIKSRYPHLLLRNQSINDAELQLSQFQTDLIIDNMMYSNRAIQHHVLFTDEMTLICRKENPLLTATGDMSKINRPRISFCCLKEKISAFYVSGYKVCFLSDKSILPVTIF